MTNQCGLTGQNYDRMKVLVTGAKGFVGKNLCAQLKNIRDGKAHNYPVKIDEVFEYDVDSTSQDLDRYCREADFVFNLAGVNRPQDPKEFMEGNFGFATILLETLKKHQNRCPVMISSSTQAELNNPYGESKRAGEELMRRYSDETGVKVLIYRFPNLFGKWCRPNYNSAVATFCNNIARNLPVSVNNRSTKLTLLYIDDLVDEMIAALSGNEHYDESLCVVPITHEATLGEIVDLLEKFHQQPTTLEIPDIPAGSFEKKLYSTYLSYLPSDKIKFRLKMNIDNRGSFTELLKSRNTGQISVNISKPGITKGEHWHNTKWEFFIVVSGHGLIQMRKIGTDEILEFEVSGDNIEAVHMLPGYTHNIINLSESENLVTMMWANESFAPNHPDTYFEKVSNGE